MTPAKTAYRLDRVQLEAAFAALRKAADTFRPSPLEARLYLWLGRCSTLAVLSFVGVLVNMFVGVPYAFAVLAAVFVTAGVAAGLLLLVNVSLIAGTLRQRWLLRKLGLHTVSRSAWKAERRRHLGWRIGGGSLTTVGAILFVLAGLILIVLVTATRQSEDLRFGLFDAFVVALFGVPGAAVLIWRMVERSREQLAVAADADRLRAMLTSIQAQSGSGPVVVPAAVMERVAKIEIAQIARERATAVAASARSADRGYSLVVGPDVSAYKATLESGARLAVEDLIGQVLEQPLTDRQPDAGGLRQVRSADGSTELDYLVDESARRVQIVAVRGLGPVAVSH